MTPRTTTTLREGRAAPANLLGAFRDWQAADRRQSPRHEPAGNKARVWVGWWDGDAFPIQRGTLLDLSRGGARVILPQRPPAGQAVWACVGSPEPSDSIEAKVLGDARGPSGQITRLKFDAPCPASFFQALGCPASLGGLHAVNSPTKGRDTP